MLNFDNFVKVDLDFMNSEHEIAFNDANELERLLVVARKDVTLVCDQINTCLAAMLADTERHFAHENRSMDEHDFPAKVRHQTEHQRVLDWMREEIGIWSEQGDLQRLEKFGCEDFPRWLVNHIVTMDTVTASFINSRGG